MGTILVVSYLSNQQDVDFVLAASYTLEVMLNIDKVNLTRLNKKIENSKTLI